MLYVYIYNGWLGNVIEHKNLFYNSSFLLVFSSCHHLHLRNDVWLHMSDDLLLIILGLLMTDEAVRTCVLSKRWNCGPLCLSSTSMLGILLSDFLWRGSLLYSVRLKIYVLWSYTWSVMMCLVSFFFFY